LEAGQPMPPTRALPAELVSIYQKWIEAGMPNTAADAAALSATQAPAPDATDSSATPPPEATPTP